MPSDSTTLVTAPLRTMPRICKHCGASFLARPSAVKAGQALYCSRKCMSDAWRKPKPPKPAAMSIAERFWQKVNKAGPVPAHCPELGPCWLWTAAHIPQGYGDFFPSHGHSIRAHRFAWIITNGPIPDRLDVCHKCDKTACVRPDHLFLGTIKENMADMCAKDRHYKAGLPCKGDLNYSHQHPEARAGERNGRAKLTAAKVVEIRTRQGESYAKLGREYGVSATTISMIQRGLIWRTTDHIAAASGSGM